MGAAMVPEQLVKRVWALVLLDKHREPGTESIFEKEPQLLTSALLGIGERQVQKVLEEAKEENQGKKKSPESKKKEVKPRRKFTKKEKNAQCYWVNVGGVAKNYVALNRKGTLNCSIF